MEFQTLTLIALWLGWFWLIGWLLLPLTRRIFGNLPDGGLAAGRILFLAFLTGFAYHAAALRALPLDATALLVFFVPPLVALRLRDENFSAWLETRRRRLAASDLVFVATFGLFLWLRLRHPELNDLEKLMDGALLGALMRERWLPMENPWFSGTPLTSYYHFGPLMGALPARAFGLAPSVAYNLVQPLFCALFVSALWSVGAALGGTAKRGLVVVVCVALLGHFEPIRQWKNPLPNAENHFARLDWWSTSRVFPDTTQRLAGPLETFRAWRELPKSPWTQNADYPWFTISEYPAFTMTTGDLHAHFFALALAALLFCLCWSLFGASPRRRAALVFLLGPLLGIFAMTNTWDVPIYVLLAVLCVWRSAPRAKAASVFITLELGALMAFTAWPYLQRFKSQVSGAVFELWPASPVPFVMFWGGWLALLGFGLWNLDNEVSVEADHDKKSTAPTAGTEAGPRQFTFCLAVCGFLAMIAPQIFYMKGFFGDGGLRHQDTVFKFGLQAWLLLGTAAVALALRAWAKLPKMPRAAWAAVGAIGVVVPLLCSTCVMWTRAVRDAPRDVNGKFVLSLDGARFVSDSERKAFDWLRVNASPGSSILEAVGENEKQEMGGDFTTIARVSGLTGVPTPLGWPQHVWMWGNEHEAVRGRWETVRDIYSWPSDADSLAKLHELKVHFVFVGGDERRLYDGAALDRLRQALTVVFEDGDVFICRVP